MHGFKFHAAESILLIYTLYIVIFQPNIVEEWAFLYSLNYRSCQYLKINTLPLTYIKSIKYCF